MTVITERAFNVAEFLPLATQRSADQKSLIYKRGGRWQSLTFGQLDKLVNGYAHALRQGGIEPGHKTLLMVKSGPEFVALTFALFKLGALPVLIDPGMGLRGVLSCIRQLQPEALVGIPAALAIRALFRSSFRSVKRSLCIGGPRSLRPLDRGSFPMAQTRACDEAAILFTSGSTGPAKGVVYHHGIFQAQVAALQQMYDFVPGDIDMPGFPLFALFSTALGVTCLIPELNPSRPAACDPARLVAAMQEWNVHSAQGSPAIWNRVGRYCERHRIRLPGMKRVITFGAPISVDLLRVWQEILPPSAQVHTPYGATEALPVTTIGSHQILRETAALSEQGHGTCVGGAAPGTDIRVIRISDDAIDKWTDDLLLPNGDIGEIVVAGDVVTARYEGLAEATLRSKIQDGGRVWHRMGDVGYFDGEGRLWFCGRKAHRVESPDGKTYFSVNAEGMCDTHPDVYRTALVGVRGQPVLIVEPHSKVDRPRVQEALLERLQDHPLYRDVHTVLFHPSFPVDPRHNAKIHREELAIWASGRVH